MVLSLLDLHPLTDISRADKSAVCKCHGLRISLHSLHSPTLQEPALADFAAYEAGRTVSVAAVLSIARHDPKRCASGNHYSFSSQACIGCPEEDICIGAGNLHL